MMVYCFTYKYTESRFIYVIYVNSLMRYSRHAIVVRPAQVRVLRSVWGSG